MKLKRPKTIHLKKNANDNKSNSKINIKSSSKINDNNNNNNINNNINDDNKIDLEDFEGDLSDSFRYMSNKNNKGADLSDFIYSLFPKKIYAEIYYAWCKDCNEQPSAESAKYFRDELLSRNNKDIRSFNFKSMRVGKNFLSAFGGNLPAVQLRKVELQDNLVNDECMHNIKNLISAKQIIYLNLASNQISTEGLKIIQHEVTNSNSLKYLNFGVCEGSFRVNNFSGDGGIVLARIILNNRSIETLILQENLLGEDAGDKIGAALIQNETLKKLVVSDNKIRNKGARSILENGNSLISLDLSDNDISPEICFDLKNLIIHSKKLREVIWNGNYVGLKGINFIVDALKQKSKLKSLSLRNTSIGKSGVKTLAEGLKGNEFLQILDLGSNSMEYESFKYLCDSMNTNKIRILRCKNNYLGDDSMKYFSEVNLSKDNKSNLVSFDFSSCKIYDQGLIYLLNSLTTNTKINWINVRDNYFSQQIDFVILNYLEKNTTITHIDLTKNRFSFKCLQNVNKIIKRNRNIQNNKEPNKLLVELYSLKYENTKLNELREALKSIENYNAKLKLSKIDLRQNYEISKKENYEKIQKKKIMIEKQKKELDLKQNELAKKTQELEDKKIENQKKLEEMQQQYIQLQKEKEDALKYNEQIKIDTENMQNEFTKKIIQLNDNIEIDKKKFDEINKQIRDMEIKIDEIDDQIIEFEKQNPELVNKVKEEERQFLNEQDNKKVLFSSLVNKDIKNSKKDEKLNVINNVEGKKEDEKENKKEEKKEEKKEVNKKFMRKKSYKVMK